MLENCRQFLSELAKTGIDFCIWKNLHQEDEMLSSTTDIDLFVPITHRCHLQEVIHKFDGVEVTNKSLVYPHIHHYYLPVRTGKILHLHVYHHLYTGTSHVKEFKLPIEERLIKRRIIHPELGYVPSVEIQNWLTIIRYYLKKSSVIGALLYFRERADYILQNKCIDSQVGTSDLPILNELNIGSELDNSFFGSVRKGLLIRRKLSDQRRVGVLKAKLLSVVNILILVRKKIRKEKKSLVGKGTIVAITGIDGSGKSTTVNELTKEYSKKFNVKRFHLGRPSPTLLTFVFRLMLLFRQFIFRSDRFQKAYSSSQSRRINYNLISASRHVILAFERCVAARRMSYYRDKGYIVFCDRYPSTIVGKMDSPKLTKENCKFNFLIFSEQYFYNSIIRPDLLVDLQVSDKIAIQRNNLRSKANKESEAEILDRRKTNSNLEYDARNFYVFENNGSQSAVLQFISSKIWLCFDRARTHQNG